MEISPDLAAIKIINQCRWEAWKECLKPWDDADHATTILASVACHLFTGGRHPELRLSSVEHFWNYRGYSDGKNTDN